MSWKVLQGKDGETVSSEGVPYNETFTKAEGNRLRFEQERLKKNPPDRRVTLSPTYLTDIIHHIHVIDTANRGSLGEFFNRHRRRGPYGRNNSISR